MSNKGFTFIAVLFTARFALFLPGFTDAFEHSYEELVQRMAHLEEKVLLLFNIFNIGLWNINRRI